MPGPVFLECDRVDLRPLEREDVDFIQRNMNDPRIWRPALGTTPINRDVTEEFFENVIATEEDVHLGICLDGEPIGHVSLTSSEYGPDETSRARSMELSYWVDPDYHGEGYGSEAAERVVEYAFEDRNVRRIVARPGGFNEASAGLLESIGFEREGVLREASWYRGEYYDTYVYGLLRHEWNE